MKLKNLFSQITFGILIVSLFSCDNFFTEDLPECRLYVKFKYDYNMLSTDAFHTQVDKVELYVFDENGVFLFKQSEEGEPLTDINYRMEVEVPVGNYKFMAWAGVHTSYDVTPLTPGTSTITDLKLKLRRPASLIVDEKVDPLWYGEINEINFTGTTYQTETINLIKDTNKIRFVFQGRTEDWILNMNDYDYEIIDANGYLDYDNSLLEDDVLSYRPYVMEQTKPSSATVEMNTMRLMADREVRLVVTRKATSEKVLDINLTEFFIMFIMDGNKWGPQEYLDREDEYRILFWLSETWNYLQIEINGWTWRFQGGEV